MNKFEEYTWYDPDDTKVVLSYEDAKGKGTSQTYPFPFKIGWHKFTLDLPVDVKSLNNRDDLIAISLRSRAMRYPETGSNTKPVQIGHDFYPSYTNLAYDKDEGLYYTAAYTRYHSYNEKFTFWFAVNQDMEKIHKENKNR